MITAGKFKIDGNTVWFQTRTGYKVEFRVFMTGVLFEDAVKAYLCHGGSKDSFFCDIETIIQQSEPQKALNSDGGICCER